VSADKLVMGVPFYGRSYQGVAPTEDGLFQRFGGPGPGSWENGVLDWHDIEANYLPKMTRHWSDKAQTPWLFDPSTGVMVSYDDPESLEIKANFARERGLGGVMIWDLSSDDAEHSLVEALH
jgi:chitinase